MPDIIDLTEPEIIELDSDGEIVEDTNAGASHTTGTAVIQAKKKRRKRKKKASGAAASALNEELDTSTEPSRAHSPIIPDSGVELSSETGAAEKKNLADRLTEPGCGDGGEPGRRGEKMERAQRQYQERHRDGARGEDNRRERERRRSRSPRRDRDRERARDRDAADRNHRRSRSRDRDRRKRDKTPGPATPLFFEDVNPAVIPGLAQPWNVAGPSNQSTQAVISPTVPNAEATNGLLLPAHVSVNDQAEGEDDGPLNVPTPEGSDEDEDYIDYLDYDDDRRAPGMIRYWELEKLEAAETRSEKPTRFVCKRCGAEGEHKTYECPVLICLTCGARDEHLTRSCPISKVCFTCGMKGHINRTCPNRGKQDVYQSSHDCDRCGARTHRTNECPTLWRLYTYVEDDVRQEILRVREGKRMLALGEGGEGYLATDEWCYNCGSSGHLGDDCAELPHPFDMPNEPSAFSLYNILSGPFSSEAPRPAKRAPRDWETAAAFADGYGFTAPMEVGKQGRKKERSRLERQERAREEAEGDQDDWFDKARSRARSGDAGKEKRTSGRGGGGGSKANRSGGAKFKFDFSSSSVGGERDSKRQRSGYDVLPGPSRETDTIQTRGAARKPSYSSMSSRDRHDRYDRDRDRDRGSQRGPRYKGGYGR